MIVRTSTTEDPENQAHTIMRLRGGGLLAMKRGTTLISQADRKILRAFGSRVREFRERKRLSVYDLTGDDMPIRSRQHWQRIEAGQKNINLTTIVKVARSLEVSADELLKGLT